MGTGRPPSSQKVMWAAKGHAGTLFLEGHSCGEMGALHIEALLAGNEEEGAFRIGGLEVYENDSGRPAFP